MNELVLSFPLKIGVHIGEGEGKKEGPSMSIP